MRFVNTFLLLFFFASALRAETLKERFGRSQAGDFAIIAQEQTASLFLIRSLTAATIHLEEICFPASLPIPRCWQQWLDTQAPGHTAWNSYTFDLESGKLLKSYSFSKRSTLTVDLPFLQKLLLLPLTPTPDEKRRRIGPRPQNDDPDRRALWLPTLNGKKLTPITSYLTRWPADDTPLSSLELELYFHPDFSFPLWTEVKSSHYIFKLRTLDLGHNLRSPQPK